FIVWLLSTPAPVDTRPKTTVFRLLVYKRAATREETILATLEANGMPTLSGAWYYIGPFPNPAGNKGFAVEYPPEKEINLTQTYDGKNKTKVSWKEFPNFQVGQIVNLRLFPGTLNDYACIYLYHEIR